MSSATDAAKIIRQGSAADRGDLGRQLAADPIAAYHVLNELSAYPDAIVRDWVIWAAAKSLPRPEAVQLLERLSRDADADVRTEAMRALVELDDSYSRRLIPAYLAALRSRDFIEVVDAIWRLVQFRAIDARPAIENLATHGEHPLVKNNAEVARLVLAGDEGDLIAALDRHDHERIPLWIKGLLFLGSDRAIAAVKRYADEGPDEACRRRAATALRKAHQTRPLGAH